MLKWLKQKPASGQDETVVAAGTTENPLATIQINPPITSLPKTPFSKNSNSNPNEVYAVSRVNPLYEEDGGSGLMSPGIHSGSSGYDSEPSEDDSQNDAESEEYVLHGATRSDPLDMMPNSRLFSNQEDSLIQQEAATTLVGVPGQNVSSAPILNVVKQNPAFVSSIAVAIDPPLTGRPLVPIAESKVTGWKSVTAIPVPIRNIDPPAKRPGDKIGSARLIQRNTNYVQSIRIVPASKPSTPFIKRSNSNPPTSRSTGASLLRKPSVTFSDRVDVVDGKLVPSSPRRLSADQDSIVTDSLLMMTSSNGLLETARHSRSNSGAMFTLAPELSDNDEEQPDPARIKRIADEGLTSFSDSLSRNRIIKQVMTRSSASPPPPNESEPSRISETEKSTTTRRPRNASSASKSPFGGIADHYAAAKEIAKEIESYSQGTTKSTRISMVKDVLLSNRGRVGVGSTPSASSSSPPWASGQLRRRDEADEFLNAPAQSQTLVTAVVHLKSLPPTSSSGPSGESTSRGQLVDDEETARAQAQVYVKANDSSFSSVTMTKTLKDSAVGQHICGQQYQLAASSSSPLKQHVTTKRTLVYDSHVDSHYRQPEGQVQVPIYEALPPGTSSHLRSHSHDDSDSGNSTDRSPTQDHSGDEAPKLQKAFVSPNSPSSEVPPTDPVPGHKVLQKQLPSDIPIPKKLPPSSSSNEKVMIVSGDSQNMVVDLSGVPPDLREAIISGSGLVAVPDELNQRLEPGYAMIAIPQNDHEYEILPSPKPHAQTPPYSKESSKASAEGRDNYVGKNLAQVWESMQQKGKGKQRITTVLPHHPNPDSHTTADFTIEGQSIARQAKRVKRLKTRRCCCRIIGIFIFLIAFLGVIVTLSLVYTKGKHYFGPV